MTFWTPIRRWRFCVYCNTVERPQLWLLAGNKQCQYDCLALAVICSSFGFVGAFYLYVNFFIFFRKKHEHFPTLSEVSRCFRMDRQTHPFALLGKNSVTMIAGFRHLRNTFWNWRISTLHFFLHQLVPFRFRFWSPKLLFKKQNGPAARYWAWFMQWGVDFGCRRRWTC